MAASTFQNNIRQGLQKWDKGSKSVREQILVEFISKCENMTCTELELYFQDCASLFLARLTSWLRITYMFGTCLKLQLQAIGIFVTASTGYLIEFLEVGGILTVLEIINLKSCVEEDKSEGLRLLGIVATKGRQYKEMICESYGVKVVAECLGCSQKLSTQECAQYLLHQLALGNPRYQTQVYKSLISLLYSSSAEAQRLSAYTLRQIQPLIGMVDTSSIVEPLLQLLRSLHISVQHEAGLLITDILVYEEVQQPLLFNLVTLLKHDDMSSSDGKGTVPGKVQQANAARVVREIIIRHPDLIEKLIELDVIPNLLYALGNSSHFESQRQSLATLQVFMNENVSIKELVELIVGEQLFEKLECSQDDIHDILTLNDIDILLRAVKRHHHKV